MLPTNQALDQEQSSSESVDMEKNELIKQLKQQSEALAIQNDKYEFLNQTHAVTNRLLSDSLEPLSLMEHLDEAIFLITSIPWLAIQSGGSIFLWDEESEELVLAAQHELPEPLPTLCARVPLGHCLCGKAAQLRQTVFSNHVDEQHTTKFDGMADHGHYCRPIMVGDRLVGLLNLYVDPGHTCSPNEETFLQVITNTLAGIIVRCQQDEQLALLNETLIEERNIVESVVLKIPHSPLFYPNNLRFLESSVDKTIGDIICSTICANGNHRVLLGDFTGHGLTAAIGGPLISEIFYSDAAIGAQIDETFRTLNTRLLHALPEDMFMACGCLEFDMKKMQLTLFNAGMPNIFILRNGKVIHKEPSGFVPRGLMDVPDDHAIVISIKKDDRIIMCTDGMEETTDPDGKMFGEERSIKLLEQTITHDKHLDFILEELKHFRHGERQQDDITLVELRC